MKPSRIKLLLSASRGFTLVFGLATLLVGFHFLAPRLAAQTEAPAESAETATVEMDSAALESVEVDWVEQIRSGGMTMLALGILSIAGIAFTVERLCMVRRKYFNPRGMANAALPLIENNDIDGLLRLAERHPSTLGRILTFIVDHRDNDYQKLTSMAENLGARDIIDQEERTFPLAVVASVAPLLGLLGTMIGMIEAFQLVSVYGDEGGASMLAGSIAKALITTATGLILAIPAICAFHYFKHKLHKVGVQLDKDVERIITTYFFVKSTRPAAEAEFAPEADQDATTYPQA